MLEVVLSNAFRKDVKLATKRGKNLKHLCDVVDTLAAGKPLPIKNRDHELSGDYAGFRECHVQPDWLLIYKKEEDKLILILYRTGTHSDLFG